MRFGVAVAMVKFSLPLRAFLLDLLSSSRWATAEVVAREITFSTRKAFSKSWGWALERMLGAFVGLRRAS